MEEPKSNRSLYTTLGLTGALVVAVIFIANFSLGPTSGSDEAAVISVVNDSGSTFMSGNLGWSDIHDIPPSVYYYDADVARAQATEGLPRYETVVNDGVISFIDPNTKKIVEGEKNSGHCKMANYNPEKKTTTYIPSDIPACASSNSQN